MKKILCVFISLLLFGSTNTRSSECLVSSNLTFRSGKDYALFFAVQDYSEWPDLRNPISDAETIAKELRKNYGFKTEVVKNPDLEGIYKKLRK